MKHIWKSVRIVGLLMGLCSGASASAAAANVKLLLGSGGFYGKESTIDYLASEIGRFLGTDYKSVLVIPYAQQDYDDVLATIKERPLFGEREVLGIHQATDPVKAIEEASVVLVWGGNTFRLLKTMYELKLLGPLQKKVAAGMPYIGVSAGTNLACPTIMTTNDMPIVFPPSFSALGLVPFQINPHYVGGSFYSKKADGSFEKYAGESRDDRIAEFHEANAPAVVGLPEATFLWVEGGKVVYLNGEEKTGEERPARFFSAGRSPHIIATASDITGLVSTL